MNSKFVMWIKNKPLEAFFVITFVISWISWTAIYLIPMPRFLAVILNQVGLCGPGLSSIIVTGALHGKAGIKRFLARILQWRVGVHWYLFVLFSTAALGLAAIGLYMLLGGTGPAIVFNISLSSLLSGLREEYGWRGFALPHLQKKYSALKASVIIGVIWALWHFPIFPVFSVGLPMLALFISEAVAISILLTWVRNHTRGNILLPVIHHAVYNITLYMLKIPTMLPLLFIYMVLNWILVVIIIARCGGTHLSKKWAAPTP